jgi:hypothetical protein
MLLAILTLCSAQEQVVFSCVTTKKKVVSLCSSSPLTESAGYLQYRFGTVGQTPQLTFPAALEHPKDHFVSGTMMFSGGGGAYLKFSNADFTYSVFTGIGKGWKKEGVVVQKAGRQVAYLQCKGPRTSQLGPDFFEKVQIPKDPQESEFEIP